MLSVRFLYWDIFSSSFSASASASAYCEGISMNLWGEAAEGRPSLLKSFQNIYGILRESLGTFVQPLGNSGNSFQIAYGILKELL